MQILLVESDPLLRVGYAYCLQAEGWRTIQAERIRPELFLNNPYSLAIVDASILADDGRPLWRIVAERSRRPIIVLALSLEQERQLRRCHLPNVAFLVKPFSLRHLVDLVHRLCVHQEVA